MNSTQRALLVVRDSHRRFLASESSELLAQSEAAAACFIVCRIVGNHGRCVSFLSCLLTENEFIEYNGNIDDDEWNSHESPHGSD